MSEFKNQSCRTCVFCQYIKCPSITGNPIDFVCQLKSSVIEDITIKNCDTMYEHYREDGETE